MITSVVSNPVSYQGTITTGSTSQGLFNFLNGTGFVPGTPVISQIFTADGSGGRVESIPVSAGGSGYLVPPNITISGNGYGATAVAIVSGGVVISIQMVTKGGGFQQPPAVNVDNGNFSNGVSFELTNTHATETLYYRCDGVASATCRPILPGEKFQAQYRIGQNPQIFAVTAGHSFYIEYW